VESEHDCTTAAAVAGTIVVGTTDDCPSTTVEDGTTVLWVGYTPYGTLEEHR
jgi:hypothetical protein